MTIRATSNALESITHPYTLKIAIVCAFALATIHSPSNAAESAGGAHFFRDTKPIVDMRLRLEQAEQAGIPDDANALTLRARLGFETGKRWQTSLLAEGEFVTALAVRDGRP